ncbi:1,2-phenylacetyl-CoA epoxidase subunit PaaD [Camelliibacillus cellulosilyticus]|uniref:1,2-phenylacetyl-CoA epoxidase subunit PaaD n=1 Tax=Camelliibacillus cellulosilyticus TaxID=2174486 RepID=A0ABV9GR43_9BACL
MRERVLAVLQTVKDPELPTISIVDLGMLDQLEVAGDKVSVKLLPTFSGCPALDLIEKEVKEALLAIEGVTSVQVIFSFDPPWTTDRISREGREQLKVYGISPPPPHHKEGDPWEIACPYCGSTVVTMENIFGPTACRSILYCRSCRNPFEAMKPVANLNALKNEEEQHG